VSSGTRSLFGRADAVQDGAVQTYRLRCSAFWVDVRLLEVNGRWIASADTSAGPTLGRGTAALEALWEALAPYDGVIGELLASLPLESREADGRTLG
jgi:hypothetical protein